MSEQKDMILENFLSSAIRTLDTDEIYNILMDSLILLLHPQGLLLTREFDTLKSKKVPQSLEIGLFFCQIFIFII